jgi:hypothetical protein
MIAYEQNDNVAAADRLRQSLDIAYGANELWLAAEILEGLARVKVAAGTVAEALRLFGKAMTMREESGSEMPAAERSGYERSLDLARKSVGEAAFSEAIDQGKATPLSEIVEAHRPAGL